MYPDPCKSGSRQKNHYIVILDSCILNCEVMWSCFFSRTWLGRHYQCWMEGTCEHRDKTWKNAGPGWNLTCVCCSLSLSGYFNFLCLYLCTTPVTSGFLILELCVFLVVICLGSCCTSRCPWPEFLSFGSQLIRFLLFSDYLLSISSDSWFLLRSITLRFIYYFKLQLGTLNFILIFFFFWFVY